MQRFAGAKKPLWLGALFALAFACAFVLPYATRITFTPPRRWTRLPDSLGGPHAEKTALVPFFSFIFPGR